MVAYDWCAREEHGYMALIVVVEDEHELAALLKRQLEGEGHQVVVAGDGQTALILAGQR